MYIPMKIIHDFISNPENNTTIDNVNKSSISLRCVMGPNKTKSIRKCFTRSTLMIRSDILKTKQKVC